MSKPPAFESLEQDGYNDLTYVFPSGMPLLTQGGLAVRRWFCRFAMEVVSPRNSLAV